MLSVKATWEITQVKGFITVCVFNNGYSHIAVDDHCWVILNGGKPTFWIFDQAAFLLKQLPSTRNDYVPWREYYVGMEDD